MALVRHHQTIFIASHAHLFAHLLNGSRGAITWWARFNRQLG